jgi:hypothetical protein
MDQLFHPVPMEEDGNCFFRGVARAMYNKAEHHLIVRAGAIKYMEQNLERFAPFMVDSFAGNIRDYIEAMRRAPMWADHAAIQATADQFRLIIVIHENGTPDYTTTPYTGGGGVRVRTVHLQYVDKVHYDYLVPDAERKQQDALCALQSQTRHLANLPQTQADRRVAKTIHEAQVKANLKIRAGMRYARELDM